MIRTLGALLLYAAIALRAVARFAGEPTRGLMLVLLTVYGVLLLAEPWVLEGQPWHWPDQIGSPKPTQIQPGSRPQRRWEKTIPWIYQSAQAGVVVGLLCLPPHIDYFAGLFIPLSLQAVSLFGWKSGLVWIAIFAATMPLPLSANVKGWPYAAAMTIIWTGANIFFGGYAQQVRKARDARRQNQRLLADLQAVYRQQQSYAAQVEDLASELERSRLVRELHDSITQTVFSMNLTAQTTRLLLAKDQARAAGQLRRLEELASGAMGEIQDLVSQLRPRSIAEEGLPAALQRLAVEHQGRGGLEVSVEVVGANSGSSPEAGNTLPEQVEVGLYRIAQEALNNVAKHAGITQATIRLDLSVSPAFLCIEDLGCGFDPQAAQGQRGHLGLTGMAERARELGWKLSVDSAPGRGTRIRVEQA